MSFRFWGKVVDVCFYHIVEARDANIPHQLQNSQGRMTWDMQQLYMLAHRRGSSTMRSWSGIKRISRGTRMCVFSVWRLCSVFYCLELPTPAMQPTPESNPGVRAGQETIPSKTPIPCHIPHQQLPSQPDHCEHHSPM